MAQARILIIEDQPFDAERAQRVLAGGGYGTFLARDGEEGIQAARRERPALIVCDIGMPKVGGIGVVQALRSDPSFDATPIVAVTGHGEPSDREHLLAIGFDAHFAKPVPGPALLEEIARLLARPRLR